MFRIILILFVFIFNSVSFANQFEYSALEAADIFFQKMQRKKYEYLWNNLSEKSQKRIVSDIESAAKKTSKESYEEIFADFNNCGEICKSFWNGYLSAFSTQDILEDTEWSFGKISKRYIEIRLTYKKSDKPVFLKLYKESDKWKIGLTESFWLRKRLQ